MTDEFADPLVARTFLFVPGSRPDRFAKAEATQADVVLIDLEDAVGESAKETARENAAQWLTSHHAAVRVNSGPGFTSDLNAIAAKPGLIAIVIPKCESTKDIDQAAAVLPDNVAVLALVETALGCQNAGKLAAHPRKGRLVLGNIDYALDLGLTPTLLDEPELASVRSTLVLVSRVAAIAPPVDGVVTSLDQPNAMAVAARVSRAFGFTGRLCLHPRQLEPVHRAFAPSADEVQWAQRVLAQITDSTPTIRVDGQMIDKPLIARARNILTASRRHGPIAGVLDGSRQ